MALKLITPSAALVALADLKRHVRVDFDDDDTYLTALGEVAQAHIDGAEGWLGRAIGGQTWELRIDCFPHCVVDGYSGRIHIPLPPLQSVDEIEYVDANGATQTISDFREFGVGSTTGAGFVLPAYGTSWPATRHEPEAVRITFTAGYEAAPAAIGHAIKLLVGTWYENREDAAEIKLSEMPKGVDALLMPLRIWG